jgi:hypothetical protein
MAPRGSGASINPMMLVHGSNFELAVLRRPLARSRRARRLPIYDKGSGALVVTETSARNQQGETNAHLMSSIFIRTWRLWRDRAIGKYEPAAGTQPGWRPGGENAEKQALSTGCRANQAAMGLVFDPILHGASTGFASRAALKHFGQ